MEYVKADNKKNFHISGKSPRDHQFRGMNTDLVNKLQEQLVLVTEALSNKDRAVSQESSDKIYSQDELNIILQEQLTLELNKRSSGVNLETEKELARLKDRVRELEIQLAAKDQVIDIISKRPVVVNSAITDDTIDKSVDVPEMDTVVIDPSNTTEGMTSHIKIDSSSCINKNTENLGATVNKLKNILGKQI